LYRCRREARETLPHLHYAGDTGNLAAPLLCELQDKGEDGLHQLAAVVASIEQKIRDRGKAKPGTVLVREDEANYSSRQSSAIYH
jgi:hypothetical protein